MRSNLLLSTLLKASALVGCTSQVTAQLGNDPADSWLVYAKAPGKDSKVLSVNATWVVLVLVQDYLHLSQL